MITKVITCKKGIFIISHLLVYPVAPGQQLEFQIYFIVIIYNEYCRRKVATKDQRGTNGIYNRFRKYRETIRSTHW